MSPGVHAGAAEQGRRRTEAGIPRQRIARSRYTSTGLHSLVGDLTASTSDQHVDGLLVVKLLQQVSGEGGAGQRGQVAA